MKRSELEELSMNDLYRIARDKGVHGRSKMSREELIDALAEESSGDKLPELFEQAEQAIGAQTLSANAQGRGAIRELLEQFGYFPEEWEDMEFEEQADVLHELPDERIFVTLQREADERDIDIDYGI